LNGQPGPDTEISINTVDANGYPTNLELGRGLLSGDSMYVPTNNYPALYGAPTKLLPVTFASPIPVASGTTYAWVTHYQGPQQTPQVLGTKSDTYSDGRALAYGDRWRAISPSIYDFVFETFLLDP
jgi:hypothetical protein